MARCDLARSLAFGRFPLREVSPKKCTREIEGTQLTGTYTPQTVCTRIKYVLENLTETRFCDYQLFHPVTLLQSVVSKKFNYF